MAVGAAYLTKMQRAARIKTLTADITAELTDSIEEARADLIAIGVIPEKANDETDSLILGAIRCFIRWKFAYDDTERIGAMGEYMSMRDELRRRRDYGYYAVTFTVTDDDDPVPDAEIVFNGEIIITDDDGEAIFYYVSTGTNQAYKIEADGYAAVEGTINVTGSAEVGIELIST